MARLIRDWTDSETIDSITESGEVFFARLTMKADDYGYFTANPKLLKSQLYPLRDEETAKRGVMTAEKIKQLLKECEKAGLIQLLIVKDKPVLFIPNFGQRLRIKKSKYVDNTNRDDGYKQEHVSELRTSDVKKPLEEKRIEVEQNTKPNKSHVEIFFKDLENSTFIEDIARIHGIKPEQVKSKISDFRKKADLTYPTFERFVNHFKNWFAKEGLISMSTTSVKKRNTI